MYGIGDRKLAAQMEGLGQELRTVVDTFGEVNPGLKPHNLTVPGDFYTQHTILNPDIDSGWYSFGMLPQPELWQGSGALLGIDEEAVDRILVANNTTIEVHRFYNRK